MSVNGGLGGGFNPLAATKYIFFLKREKYAECSETENYATIVCDIFARLVKNLDNPIFS